MPQLDWISDKNGELLVNDVGRFEQLGDDFQKICSKIGAADCALPHVKQSTRGNYRQYYDDNSMEIIRKWFEKDIEYFGYVY